MSFRQTRASLSEADRGQLGGAAEGARLRSGKGFANLGMDSALTGFDPGLYTALDLKAKAGDGVEVPLSFVTAKDARHPRPVLLMAYGSYGISEFPAFGTRTMATLPNGIDYAVCHVLGAAS